MGPAAKHRENAARLYRLMRHALRRLIRTPIFALTAMVTLGVGIGANALIFSVVHGVLLKPLPFQQPERLVGLWHLASTVSPQPLEVSPSLYFTYREHGRVFEDVGMWDNGSATLTGRGEPEQVDTLSVTDGTLPLLGIQPALGRVFSKEDDRPGGPSTVMLSYRYWQRAFAGDAAAIGQQLTINGTPRQIVGVLPEGFRFLRYNPVVVVPFRLDRSRVTLGQFSFQGVARLKPEVTLAQANADVARLIPLTNDSFPPPAGFTRDLFHRINLQPHVRPFEVDAVGDIGKALWILLGAVGLTLLVACANVANLFLVRAEGRQQELAVRMALGAGAGRIARELLTESMLLAAAGGAFGTALAYAGVRLLLYLEPARLPRLDEITIDPIVLLFTLAVSVVAGLLFGAIPVVKYARPRLAFALREGGRSASDSRGRHRARNTLVGAQVALAVVLLVASGLMIRTFIAMRDVPPGFVRPDEVLTLRISTPGTLISDPAQTARTHEQIVRRIEAIAGVESVGVGSTVTMAGGNSGDALYVEDRPKPEGQLPDVRRFKFISERYFETVGNPVLAGRSITWSDVHTLSPVAVVSDNLAREIWGTTQAALGKRIRENPSGPWREVIGVVGDDRHDGVTQAAPKTAYFPIQMRDFWGNRVWIQRGLLYAVRTSRLQSPDLLREVQQAVWQVNPNLPVANVRTLRAIYDDSMAHTSFTLVIIGIAAAVTLLLGVVGIYGVIAYVVAQRRREVGIRMALGARAAEVQRLFIAKGMVVIATGVLVGLAAAAALGRLISSVLFGVSAFDPVTYSAAAVSLGLIALLATWLPARHATRVDPALALRGD
jgi:putative ABC transport system permease protein